MNQSISKLFVYGSLRRGFHHAAYRYISKHFTFTANAKVRGLLYDLGEYPAAIQTSEDFFITGELYELNKAGEFEWAFEQLDDYEGLNTEEGETQLYKRELAEVISPTATFKAWIYWYVGDVSGLPLIESGDIFESANYKNKQ